MFNPDFNKIGFYQKYNELIIINDNKENNYISIFIKLFILFVLLIILFLLILKLRKLVKFNGIIRSMKLSYDYNDFNFIENNSKINIEMENKI